MKTFTLVFSSGERYEIRAESTARAIALSDREFERRRKGFHSNSYELKNAEGRTVYQCRFSAVRST